MSHAPRLLVAVSGGVVLLCTALQVHGALHTGITTDEPVHVMRLRNFFETGWYALDWDFLDSRPGDPGTNTYVYAPVATLLLHAWSVLWGVESWGEVSASAAAYDARHLGIVAIAGVGTLATAALARLLTGSWRWGLVAAACLVAVPMWTGHAMFNVKDVPVATGNTLVTLGLALLVLQRPTTVGVRLLRVLVLVAGLVLTQGTRPGMWPGIVAALAVLVLGFLLLRGRVLLRAALVDLALALAASAAVLVATYPNLFAHPLRSLSRTAGGSAGFREGESSSVWYVPRNLVEEVPLLLLVALVTGLVVGALGWWGLRRTDPVLSTRLGLVGVQALTMPVAAVVLGADLYHGLRQLLFFLPAAAVLMAYGIAWWLTRLRRPGPRRAGGRLVLATAVVALVAPVVDQVLLQPYQTVYVNLATDVVVRVFSDTDNRPGGDYWRTSIPELVADNDLDHLLLCKADVDKDTDVATPHADGTSAYSTGRSTDCRVETTGPLMPLELPMPDSTDDGVFDGIFVEQTPANCTPLDRVTRWRHGAPFVLTVLATCDVEAQPLTQQAATPGAMWPHAVDGWRQFSRQMVLEAPYASAKLAFAPSAECRAYGCTLSLMGDVPAGTVATVNGDRAHRQTEDHQTAGAMRIPVTAEQARAESGVWVMLRRGGEPLYVTLRGLAAERPRSDG